MSRLPRTLFLLLFLLLGGCGYQVGSLMHPQVKTVAVAPVVNETVAYNVAAEMRGLLCECFMTDGSLKLVDEKEADCIVYARVLSIAFSEVNWSTVNDDLFVPNEWRVKMTVEFSVIIPGSAKPLISTRSVTGSAEFQTGPDMYIGRRNGIRQAAYDAAKQLVTAVTEGW
ncbi:LPS assembly lipoprotein LptE [uncultured Victivallis sp.]|uniref:LPS assembly lipoprotein LptE n=1 Tax=uncultured Victivallis sp. TaxID=354118 RepID=UPI0025E3F61E|nr:LPS assembly lipoprotein LptE [uncultured Victivallis sp.]